MFINHFGLSLDDNKVSAKGYFKHLSSLLHTHTKKINGKRELYFASFWKQLFFIFQLNILAIMGYRIITEVSFLKFVGQFDSGITRYSLKFLGVARLLPILNTKEYILRDFS